MCTGMWQSDDAQKWLSQPGITVYGPGTNNGGGGGARAAPVNPGSPDTGFDGYRRRRRVTTISTVPMDANLGGENTTLGG